MRTSMNLSLAAIVILAAVMMPRAAHASLTRIVGPSAVVSDGRLVDMFDVTFDSVNQVYLAVWGTFGHGPTNGQFISVGGSPIGGVFAISEGSQQAGWARVTYGGGKFLVAYTKIMGSGTHARAARFVTYSGGSPSLSSEIPIDTWSGGAGSSSGVAYSNGRYLVSWWTDQESTPQSYVTILNASGAALTTKVKVTTSGDGQTDPEIACDPGRGQCLVVGQQWGVFNPGFTPGTWGQFIRDDNGALIGGGFTVSYGSIQKEATVAYSAAGDRYLVAYSRLQMEVHGAKISAASRSVLGDALLRSAAESPEGVGYGMPKIVYNPTSQTSAVAMMAWVSTAVLELDRDGWVAAGSFQLVPGPLAGTKVIAAAADSGNSRFLVADFQEFQHMRASVFAAVALGDVQPRPDCSYTLSTAVDNFGAWGGGAGFTVTTGSDCAWTASTNANWVTLSSSSQSGTGTKTISYSVGPNPSTTTRTAVLSVGTGSIVITQSGRTGKVTDLNGDGRNDLLWQNRATGALSVWRMQGVNLIEGVSLSPAVVPPAWKIVGSLDANHDGQADLLWQHDSGYVSIWLMSGETMLAAVELTASAAADPRWRIIGTGDMDRDGHDDVLWQHLDGTFAVWYMDGAQLRPGSAIIIGARSDPAWRIAGAEDFDGDGRLDFLWHHAVTGQVAIWRMNDRTLLDDTPLGFSVSDVDWQIEATTDLNNDAKPDLIWRNTKTGGLAAWLMDGVHFRVENGVWLNPGQVPDVNWRIVGPR